MENDNKVEYDTHFGGDVEIAAAAWVSTGTDARLKTDEERRNLIVNKLWDNASGQPHKTPFERGGVTWLITCDAATHIQLLKHRMANINGESARYKEIREDRFYLPEDWNGKWRKALQEHTEAGLKLYHDCLSELRPELGHARAKESARMFRTYNAQTKLSVQMNMSCFWNFVNLRKSPQAQLEIRNVCAKMIEVVKNIEGNPFKHTMEAFKL